MSQGSPDRPPFPFSDEPIDAEIVEVTPAAGSPAQPPFPNAAQPKKKRSPQRFMALLFSIAVVLFLFCGGGLLLIFPQGFGKPSIFQTDTVAVTPLASEQDSLTAALDGTWQIKDSDPRYREMRSLLSKLEKAGARENSTAFAKLVDWPAHMTRYYKAYRHQPLGIGARSQLATLERSSFAMPQEASEFQIAAIQERSAEERYVYTYAQAGPLANSAFLFHLRQQGGDWKLVDWADVGELIWRGETNALGAGPVQSDAARTSQNLFVGELDQFDSLRTNGDLAAAEAALRRAESHTGVPALQDANHYLVALRWHLLGNIPETQRVLQQVANPDGYPFAHHLTALVHYGQGEPAEALAAIGRFERCAGFHYDLAVRKVHCHAALRQPEEAAAAALAILRYAPAKTDAIHLALEHATPKQLPEALALLPKTAATAEALSTAAHWALQRKDLSTHQAIRDYVAKHFPGTADAQKLDAQRLHYQGEWEPAIALYKQLYEQQTDPAKRSAALMNWVDLALKFQPVAEIYSQCAQPREFMKTVTDGLSYDEAMIDARRLAQLLPLHRQRDPQDPRLRWYDAMVAVDKQDWSTAVPALTDALASIPPGDEEQQYFHSEVREQLLKARYHHGEALAALREAAESGEVYQSLANAMVSNQDWEHLKKLNERYRQPDDLWRRYYELRLRERDARQTQHRAQISAVAADYRALMKANLGQNIIPKGYLQGRLDALSIEGPGWRTYLETHSEPETLLARLIERFERENDRPSLQRVLEFARDKAPGHSALQQWEIDQRWQQHDYAGLIAYCEANPPQEETYYYWQQNRRERVVLSHLLLGAADQAWDAASNPEPDVKLQWYVRLASGKLDDVRSFWTEHAKDLYSPLAISEDAWQVQAIATFLHSDDFRRLRAEMALPLNHTVLSGTAMILFPGDIDWTEALVNERLQVAKVAGVEVQQLAQPPLVTKTFRLRTSTGDFLLTAGSGKYTTDADLKDYSEDVSPDFQRAVSAHHSWLALEMPAHLRPEAEADWLKVIAALVPDAVALWASPPTGAVRHGALTPEVTKQLAAAPEALKSFATHAFPYLIKSDELSADEPERRWFARCRDVARGNRPPGRVQIQIACGNALEEHWLEVVEVTHENWGDYSLRARMQQSSEINPLCRQGDLIRLSAYELRAWQD